MTDESLPGDARFDAFIDLLALLRKECGWPSLRDLVAGSERVMARYQACPQCSGLQAGG